MLRKKDLTKEEKKIYDKIRDNTPEANEWLDLWFKGKEPLPEKISRAAKAITINNWGRYQDRDSVLETAMQKASRYTLLENLLDTESQFYLWRTGRVRDLSLLSISKDVQNYKRIVETVDWAAEEAIVRFVVSRLNYKLMQEASYKKPKILLRIEQRMREKWGPMIPNQARILSIKKKIFLSKENSLASKWTSISLTDFTEVQREKLFTEDFLIKAVTISGNNLPLLLFMNPDYVTYNVCLAAVKKSGTALHAVPPHLKTKELCRIAVKNAPTALKDVPVDLQDPKIILQAVLTTKGSKKYIKKRKENVRKTKRRYSTR
jgi:hypothetical protein